MNLKAHTGHKLTVISYPAANPDRWELHCLTCLSVVHDTGTESSVYDVSIELDEEHGFASFNKCASLTIGERERLKTQLEDLKKAGTVTDYSVEENRFEFAEVDWDAVSNWLYDEADSDSDRYVPKAEEIEAASTPEGRTADNLRRIMERMKETDGGTR